MRELEELSRALAKSAFRSKFHLQGKDLVYLRTKVTRKKYLTLIFTQY